MSTPIVRITAKTNPIEGSVGSYLITLDSPAPAGGLTVNFNTIGSTATFNSDYYFTVGENLTDVSTNSFTIAESASSAVLNLATNPDYESDPNEQVVVNLTDGVGYDIVHFSEEGNSYTVGTNVMTLLITTNNFHFPTDDLKGFTFFTGEFYFGTGDFNNDGQLDIAVSSFNKSVSILLRNATNTGFDFEGSYATDSHSKAIAVGDFNHDGRMDLAIANGLEGTVSVLMRNATNTGFNPKIDYIAGSYTSGIGTGDFNGDGQLDIVATNRDSSSVSVFLRNASNTGFESRTDYITKERPQSVNVADFNGDGKQDFALTNENGFDSVVSVFLRNASNTGFEPRIDYVTGFGLSSSNVADFNNDGQMDIVIANYSSGVTLLLRNATNTGFDAPLYYGTGFYPTAITVGDFNHDGQLDIAANNLEGNLLSVLLRNEDNTDFYLNFFDVSKSTIHSLVSGDFNNDGKSDLAISNFPRKLDLSTSSFIFDHEVTVLLNKTEPSASLTIINNDAPVLNTPDSINYIDTMFDDNFTTVTGKLVASDANNDTLTYGIVGGTDNGNGTISSSNAYGQLIVNKVTGDYQFVADNIAINALTTDVHTQFTVTVSDGQLSDSKSLSINITQNCITESLDNDYLVGTVGNDVISGLAGNDTIYGLAGNDDLNGGLDNDLIYGSLGDDTVIGGQGSDTLYGGAGNDWLDEFSHSIDGAGADVMRGGKGNDHYTVDDVNDIVQEYYNQGEDTVSSFIKYTLPDHVENLYVFSAASSFARSPTGIGNALNNKLYSGGAGGYLYGLDGDDSLYGHDARSGHSLLYGGKGNDSYYIRGDSIIEYANEGEDTAYATTYFVLPDNVENLVFISDYDEIRDMPLVGYGNELNNKLTSSSPDSELYGLAGHDKYYVGNESVKIIETAHNGWDSVYSTTTHTLEDHVEALYLQGTANLNGYGNNQNNILNGNSGDNTLNGKAGADVMQGGAGSDYLFGGTGSDTLYGGDGNDWLDGGANNGWFDNEVDILYGGNGTDQMIAHGLDTLYGNNGSDWLWSYGDNNILYGGDGDDWLGYAGEDGPYIGGKNTYMQGDKGDDSYVVDDIRDTVKEYWNEGIDIVTSYIETYTLAKNVENLIVYGNHGIGNSINNSLKGSAVDNILEGHVGNDTLEGGSGNDILIGGLGKDYYDLEETTPATDTIRIAKGDSLVKSYDVVTDFALGTGTISTAGIDQLDLDSTRIAANARSVNGHDSCYIKSHHIEKGIISFDDKNVYSDALVIKEQNLNKVFDYLQNNIKHLETVAFISEGNTYVFQDGGSQDTVVELVGVIADSINTTGLANNAVWLV